jgi:hypothetical protein
MTKRLAAQTDQKVRGSSPFGRATEKARDLRKRRSRAFQDLSSVELSCSWVARVRGSCHAMIDNRLARPARSADPRGRGSTEVGLRI